NIFATSDSKTTKLWNTSGELIAERLGEFKKFAESVVESEGRKFFLITQDQDTNTTKIWTINGSVVAETPVEVSGSFRHIDAQRNIVVTTQGSIITDSQESGSPKLWTLSGQPISASVSGIFWDFEGSNLLTIDEKNNVFHLWNILEKSPQSLSYTNKPSRQLSPDGQFLLTSGSESNETIWSIKLWAISKNQITLQVEINQPFGDSNNNGAIPYILSDREMIAFKPLVSNTTFPALINFSEQEIITAQYQFVVGGSKYVVTTDDNDNSSARLWDLSGNSIAQFNAVLNGSSPDEQLSPDEQFLVTITPGGTAQLWDLRNSWTTLIPKNPLETTSRRRVEFSHDGELLAEYTDDPASVSLWDIISGKPITQLSFKPEERIQAIKFSPDAQVLAIVTENSLRIWDILSRSFTSFQLPSVYTLSSAWMGNRLSHKTKKPSKFGILPLVV
ncbi:MAG: WD40 repeat domain-containing protein, partial [Leptolyngbyaceae cyanobacterium SL_7_1]|nr:WD40 repeat domain-containing protein [Leptolyngbyaceae cyanobacterium SL_7_1]